MEMQQEEQGSRAAARARGGSNWTVTCVDELDDLNRGADEAASEGCRSQPAVVRHQLADLLQEAAVVVARLWPHAPPPPSPHSGAARRRLMRLGLIVAHGHVVVVERNVRDVYGNLRSGGPWCCGEEGVREKRKCERQRGEVGLGR